MGGRTLAGRRGLLGLTVLATALAFTVAGCGDDGTGPGPGGNGGDGRLASRPHTPTASPATGKTQLGLGGARDGYLYVPPGRDATSPGALAVLLHGATGSAEDMDVLIDLADEFDVVLLVPESRANTWDLAGTTFFGDDVPFVDEALAFAFDRVAVDPDRLLIIGFSDGGSYALSLGLANGDLFSHVGAWTPGFVFVEEPVGSPTIFLSHGTQDTTLDFLGTQDSILPLLIVSGYTVTFEPFVGGHLVPADISRATFEWFLDL